MCQGPERVGNGFWQPVCAVCDRVRIGTEEFSTMTPRELLEKETRISVGSYENYYETELKQELVEQYKVEECEGLLLSPRARRFEDGSLQVCTCCERSLQRDHDSPPK